MFTANVYSPGPADPYSLLPLAGLAGENLPLVEDAVGQLE